MIYLRSDFRGCSIERPLFTDTQLDSGFEVFCWTDLGLELSKTKQKKKHTDL